MKILKKTIVENQRDWDSKLKFALWAVRVTARRSTGKSPFELVYGTQALFPSQLVKPVIAMIQKAKEEPNALVRRMNKAVEFSEKQRQDLVLRWDTRREDKVKHGMFDPLWYSPFRISEVRSNNTFTLENLVGETLQLPVNGQYKTLLLVLKIKHHFIVNIGVKSL
eukprot:PITA_27146